MIDKKVVEVNLKQHLFSALALNFKGEINIDDKVAESNNVPAIKFAVEALNNRYKNSEGYEGQLITGKSPTNDGLKPYRSHAELVRDIGNPLYNSDPAFRQDVEKRLARSPELL